MPEKAEDILAYLESRVPSVATFVLRRLVDATGVSGVGVVADGAWFPDGKTVTRWRGGETGAGHRRGQRGLHAA